MRDLTKSLGGRRMNELGKLIPAYLQAASGIRWFYIYAVPACYFVYPIQYKWMDMDGTG